MLNYDSMANFTDYMVHVINSKTGEVTQGLMDNETLSYSTSATLGGSIIGNSVEGFTRGAAKAAAGRVAGDMGRDTVANNYRTVASTYKGYEGASDTGFNISMHIFPGQQTYQFHMEKMLKLTQPNTENSIMLTSYLYEATDATLLLETKDPFKGGLIHVSIGDWFLATGLFCTSSSFSFSKYVDLEGKPLYLVWDASFSPYKVLNAKELSSWHRK